MAPFHPTMAILINCRSKFVRSRFNLICLWAILNISVIRDRGGDRAGIVSPQVAWPSPIYQCSQKSV
ncbi:hypothetical protein [Microcoleus vaginatus]|uniref:hypothetical protein n=1 Tax=Microcoleus vaginatus TaxID=119532 RepID=UPI0016835614|nr:hypothetical protein [Microcoleus sp. FACHB-84]